jgi:hypothetical protein
MQSRLHRLSFFSNPSPICFFPVFFRFHLQNDMKAKVRFLHDVEASVGFTSTMMIQEFVGSTTIVPQVAFQDYFKLFSDPSLADLERCFQGGRVAAYEHTAMIKLNYKISDALDQCISKLETQTRSTVKKRTYFKDAPIANLKALQVDKMTTSTSSDGGSCTKKTGANSDSGLPSFETVSSDEDDEHATGCWIDL